MRGVAVAGHVCVDVRPALGAVGGLDPGRLVHVGPLTMTLGGSVGNTGLGLMGLGAPVRVFTAVGDDELGRFIGIELARSAGARIRVVPGASTSYSLILEPEGADRTIWHHVGANRAFDGLDLDRPADLDGVDLLHLGYPPLLPGLLGDGAAPLRRLLAGARSAGVTTSVDLAVVDPASAEHALDWGSILDGIAPLTDVLSPSLDDLTSALRIDEPFSPALVRRLADRFVDAGTAVVAVSAGRHGMLVRSGSAERLRRAGRALADQAEAWSDRTLHVPPIWSLPPVTTNGAGDASTAGLLHGIVLGASISDAAQLAAACSAAVVSGRGVEPDAVLELCPALRPLLAPGAAEARPHVPIREGSRP